MGRFVHTPKAKGSGFVLWFPLHLEVSGISLQYENSARAEMQTQQKSRCSFPETPPHGIQHSYDEKQECLYLAEAVMETEPCGDVG